MEIYVFSPNFFLYRKKKLTDHSCVEHIAVLSRQFEKKNGKFLCVCRGTKSDW